MNDISVRVLIAFPGCGACAGTVLGTFYLLFPNLRTLPDQEREVEYT